MNTQAVGERVHARLAEAGLPMAQRFTLPTNVNDIAPLIAQIQMESETHVTDSQSASIYLIHNRQKSGALFEPVSQRILPLDSTWQLPAISPKFCAVIARSYAFSRFNPGISFYLPLPRLCRITCP